MKNNSDPRLGFISKRLSGCRFAFPIDISVADMQKFHALRLENKLKNVLSVPGQVLRGNSVRMYIGGKIRTFAYFESDWIAACRVADMATLRFGPQRLKFPRPLEPEDFNFSEAQAKLDWEREAPIAQLLTDVEKHLREIGAFANQQSAKATAERLAALERQVAELYEKIQTK